MLDSVLANFQQHSMDLPCPGCGTTIPTTVAEAKAHPEIRCPGCGASIELNAAGLDQGEAELSQIIGGFE